MAISEVEFAKEEKILKKVKKLLGETLDSLGEDVLYDEENYLAQDWLGFCYLCGIGTSENPEKAAHCFYKSAEHDYPDAYYHLGLYYEKESYIHQDY